MATPAKRRRRRKKKSATQGESRLQQTDTEYWSDCVHCWYPDLHDKTYFCPPQQFNRVPNDITSIAGQSVLVPQIAKGGAVSSLQKTQNSLAQSTPGQLSSTVTSKDSHSEFDSEVEYESEEKTESYSYSYSEQSGYSQYTVEPSSDYQSVAKPDTCIPHLHCRSDKTLQRGPCIQSPSLSSYAKLFPSQTSTSLSSYAHPSNPYYPTALSSSENISHIPNDKYSSTDQSMGTYQSQNVSYAYTDEAKDTYQSQNVSYAYTDEAKDTYQSQNVGYAYTDEAKDTYQSQNVSYAYTDEAKDTYQSQNVSYAYTDEAKDTYQSQNVSYAYPDEAKDTYQSQNVSYAYTDGAQSTYQSQNIHYLYRNQAKSTYQSQNVNCPYAIEANDTYQSHNVNYAYTNQARDTYQSHNVNYAYTNQARDTYQSHNVNYAYTNQARDTYQSHNVNYAYTNQARDTYQSHNVSYENINQAKALYQSQNVSYAYTDQEKDTYQSHNVSYAYTDQEKDTYQSHNVSNEYIEKRKCIHTSEQQTPVRQLLSVRQYQDVQSKQVLETQQIMHPGQPLDLSWKSLERQCMQSLNSLHSSYFPRPMQEAPSPQQCSQEQTFLKSPQSIDFAQTSQNQLQLRSFQSSTSQHSQQSPQKRIVLNAHNSQSANNFSEHSNEPQQSRKYEQAKHNPPIPYTHKMWKCHAGPVPTVLDCHLRDDNASQRVLACIQELSKVTKQVMMVISQLQFGHYLNKPCYAATAALLPRPIDLNQDYRQGDFDLLIIHKTFGFIIFEIKSVGDNFSELQNVKSKENDILLSKVDEAIKQLNKSNHVIKHLVSDIMPNVNAINVLVLASVTKDQLSGAMTNNHSSTSASLIRCLGVQTLVEAIGLCVLSEDLPEKDKPWNVTSTIKGRFLQWWHRRVVGRGSHVVMEDEKYEQIVARFCGPATTIFIHCISTPRLELRTAGESVSETGERIAGLVLFPEQVELLNTSPPLVYLSGPPGTGKTVVLTVQGLSWLQRGHDVHVVSLSLESRAASMVIEHQLNQTWSATTPKVYRHQYNFFSFNEWKETVFTDLLVHSPDKKDILCVIADEAVSRRSALDSGYELKIFSVELISQRPNLHLWAAALEHEQRPSCLLEVIFRAPLRTPPVVSREVVRSGAMKPSRVFPYRLPFGSRKSGGKRVHTYTTSKVPVPTDGPPVERINHHVDTSGHLGKLPLECAECGRQVAQVLTNLCVGFGSAGYGPPTLQFRDVLVLCEVISSNDLVFAQVLRENGIPVKILAGGEDADIQELAIAKTDHVTITESKNVWGLERKVIIVAGSLRKRMTEDERLYGASRCTSQLVIID